MDGDCVSGQLAVLCHNEALHVSLGAGLPGAKAAHSANSATLPAYSGRRGGGKGERGGAVEIALDFP